MINTKPVVALLLMLTSVSVWSADCSSPVQPEIPDGATADMKSMLAGKEAVSQFQTANTEYLGCLNQTIDEQKAKITAGGDSTLIEMAKQAMEKLTEQYNAAVDAEEAVANKFNESIRDYKQANPS